MPIFALIPYLFSEQIFTLPEETLVYPAHDYKGFMVRYLDELLYFFS